MTTIGVDFKIKTLDVDGKSVKLQIWDTAGQERFKSLTHSYLKGADGILFVYDITQKKTFDNLKKWIKDSEDSNQNFKKVIIGNKIDRESERKVPKESLEKFCDERKLKGFEASAKFGDNIDESFEALIKMIIGEKSKDELLKAYTMTSKGRGISINSQFFKKKKKKCC